MQHSRGRLVLGIVLVLALGFLAGCPTGIMPPVVDTDGSEPGGGSDPVPEGMTRLSFLLSGVRAAGSARAGARAIGDQEIVSVEVGANAFAVHPIGADGSVSIEIAKDGLYLFGLTEYTAEGIVTNGLICAADGLGSLPISASASDTIDLGTLSQDADGNYVASASTGDLAIAFGYSGSTLDSFGSYDRSFRKFLNLDIDGNSVYDFDEGIWWSFVAEGGQGFNLDAYSYENDTIHGGIELYIGTGGEMQFKMFSGFELTGLEFDNSWTDGREPFVVGANLVLPTDQTIFEADGAGQSTGVQITELTDGRYNHWDYATRGLYFLGWGFGLTTPTMPVVGDYTVRIPNNGEYAMRNMHFPNAHTGTEGYIFPVFRFTRNKYGAFEQINWRWKIVKDGVVVPVDPDSDYPVLNELIESFTISFGNNDIGQHAHLYTGLYDWSTGALDMSPYDERFSDDGHQGYPAQRLRVMWTDVGGNGFNTNFYDEGTAFQFPAGDTPLHFEDPELLGTWILDGTPPQGISGEFIVSDSYDISVKNSDGSYDPNDFVFSHHDRDGTVYLRVLDDQGETVNHVTYTISSEGAAISLMFDPNGFPDLESSSLTYLRQE